MYLYHQLAFLFFFLFYSEDLVFLLNLAFLMQFDVFELEYFLKSQVSVVNFLLGSRDYIEIEGKIFNRHFHLDVHDILFKLLQDMIGRIYLLMNKFNKLPKIQPIFHLVQRDQLIKSLQLGHLQQYSNNQKQLCYIFQTKEQAEYKQRKSCLQNKIQFKSYKRNKIIIIQIKMNHMTNASFLCCPNYQPPKQEIRQPLVKNNKKFIKLTIKLPKEAFQIRENQKKSVIIQRNNENQDSHEYQSSKSSFFQQIRSFQPSNSTELFDTPLKTSKIYKEIQSTQIQKEYSNDTQMSESNSKGLQKLSGLVLSEMFVSSHIKDRIMMRSQLDNITQVKSDMQVSSCFHTKTRIVDQF